MLPQRLPKYVILIRLGTFRLDLVGKAQIAIASTIFAALVGARLYFF